MKPAQLMCPTCGIRPKRPGRSKGHNYRAYCTKCESLRGLRDLYGLSDQQLRRLARDPRCLICNSADNLRIDHDHTTGVVRGLLCHRHNLMVGALENSTADERAAALLYIANGGLNIVPERKPRLPAKASQRPKRRRPGLARASENPRGADTTPKTHAVDLPLLATL